MTADPSKLSVEDVLGVFESATWCEENNSQFVTDDSQTIAALCRHFLASQPAAMTAGEFAWVVTKTLRQDVVEWRSLAQSKSAASQIADERIVRAKQCDEDLREVIRLARLHNVEIKEPKP